MIRIAQLVLVAILALATNVEAMTDFCEAEFLDCKFRFAGQTTLATFALPSTADNVAFTPALVIPGVPTGIVNSNEVVPQFIDSAPGTGVTAVNVTAFGLTPTQFKPFTIVNTTTSGVGHETFQTDVSVAQDRCVRVYFTARQVLEDGVVVDNIEYTPEQAVALNFCVVFRTS